MGDIKRMCEHALMHHAPTGQPHSGLWPLHHTGGLSFHSSVSVRYMACTCIMFHSVVFLIRFKNERVSLDLDHVTNTRTVIGRCTSVCVMRDKEKHAPVLTAVIKLYDGQTIDRQREHRALE